MLDFIENIWKRGRMLELAYSEHLQCINDNFNDFKEILRTPDWTTSDFYVALGDIPAELYQFKRNIFSTLFQSMYHVLGISKERRLFYGRLNHLFRVWVTSADNLLDDEDKVVIPLNMPGSSAVMRQVVSIMAADRVLKQIIDDAVLSNVLTRQQGRIVSEKSLQILLPSAAQEASEEGGITERPEPDYVVNTIHKLKTGILFLIPLLGPEYIEEKINSSKLNVCKDGLEKFGIGCQILDDIRDISKDFLEKRQNYILSKIEWECSFYKETLLRMQKSIDINSNIFTEFPDAVHPGAQKAFDMLTEGLTELDKAGLGIGSEWINQMGLAMFRVLGVEDLTKCIKQQTTANQL
jgi:hypothetical protein